MAEEEVRSACALEGAALLSPKRTVIRGAFQKNTYAWTPTRQDPDLISLGWYPGISDFLVGEVALLTQNPAAS